MQALIIEARLRLPDTCAPKTVFMGGGTPSMLSPTLMRRLVEGLQAPRSQGGAGLCLDDVEEWTLEANPATFHLPKALLWRELGLTRISLGIQSFDSDMLRLLGRTHSVQQARDSVHILRQAGFTQVNIDLMFSLPQQSLLQWEGSLREAIALEPDHISTYNLTYEEDTSFFHQYGAKAGNEEMDVAMFHSADQMLSEAGYRHYEVSNYAREGCRSLHNLATWAGLDYIGIGPSAVGTVDGMRYANDDDTLAYTRALLAGELPRCEVEQIDAEQRRTELIGLMLRTDEGLDLSILAAGYEMMLSALCEEGYAVIQDHSLILTSRGRLLVDEIATQLIS